MCSIIGALIPPPLDNHQEVQEALNYLWHASRERGRDGSGWVRIGSHDEGARGVSVGRGHLALAPQLPPVLNSVAAIIGNLRAEPTTEFVKDKRSTDQQPYSAGGWHIVHNGTIANDKELRTHRLATTIDSAAIVETLNKDDAVDFQGFVGSIRKLKGSYAILAVNSRFPSLMYAAVNYRPLWYIVTQVGVFFASARDYLPSFYGVSPRMLPPYTAAYFSPGGLVSTVSLYPEGDYGERALVVCSGGLDSVVSATYAQRKLGMSVHLIHFLYGSRAEGPEVEAIQQVAEALGAELTLKPLPVYSKGDSKLLDPDSKVAGGEEGAEFAHEWVPARNLLLLSVAVAFAEARGIDTIVLGNNLEEAGAYPDNEPEFIARFNDMLPFAVGDGKRMRVIMPVGNMMKHEIVALGHKLGAPMHLTWSCYRAGKLHCGKCGPCFMRRKAFEINNLPEVIKYEDEQ